MAACACVLCSKNGKASGPDKVSITIVKDVKDLIAKSLKLIFNDSVISIFSRMLERLVHDQLFDFLKANKKFTCNQSAFQKLCSTITSLITSTDYWYENMDSRKIYLTLFLDLKKAFDTVDHSVLMRKLLAYGIRGSAGDWFE